MSKTTAPLKHDATCVTKHLTADIYCCMARRSSCPHATPFGYEYLCEHPDRARLCIDCTDENHDGRVGSNC